MAHQPQNVVATPVSTTEIDLSWDDVGTLEDETFDIERNSVIVEASYAGTHTAAAPYTDTGLDPDTEYSYRVRAVGGIIPAPVTPPAAPVAARVSIFTPVITISASADVTPTTVSVVAVVFASDIAATTSTTTPTTVVGSASVPSPSVATETYSDSYEMDYGATGGDIDVALSTVVTASTVLTPTITTVFAPTDIAGLAAWYDFSNISSLWQDAARSAVVTADAQAILGVTDLSGNAKHLDGLVTAGPLYKTGQMNGLAVARFDGSNDYLKVSSVFTQPTTIFIVANHTGAASGVDDTLTDSGPSGNTMRIYWNHTGGALSLYAGSVLADGTLTTSAPFIATGIFNGASSMIARSGTDTSGAGGTATPTTTLYLGVFGSTVGAYWVGDMGEVLVYNSALGTPDLNALGGWLASKWGITWTTI